MDQLILQRWSDVVGLIEAHKETQEKVEEMITVTGERMQRWARPLGYELSIVAKDAEIQASRFSWIDKRRGSKVSLAVGGFCPLGYRKTEQKHPYLWVYTEDLANFRLKEPDRIAFAQSLRAALGDEAKHWDADGVDDATGPLGRYLVDVSDSDRTTMISNPDRLFEFATNSFQPLFAIADVIDAELAKVVK
jgi:hypothetical protein